MVFSETTKAITELFNNDEAWNVKVAGMSAQEVIDTNDLEKQKTAINQAIRYQKICASVKEYREAA
jgi:chaperonin cofactor prefoldin